MVEEKGVERLPDSTLKRNINILGQEGFNEGDLNNKKGKDICM